MSVRPPYYDSLPPSVNSSNNNSVSKIDMNPRIIQNACVPRTFGVNNPRQNIFTTNDSIREYTPVSQSPNISYRFTGSLSNNPYQMPVSATPTGFSMPINNYYPSPTVQHPSEQNYSMPSYFNHFQRNPGITMNNNQQKCLSYVPQNSGYSDLTRTVNNEKYPNNACHILTNDISQAFHPCPQNTLPANRNTNNIAPPSDCANNSVIFPGNSGCIQTVSSLLNRDSFPSQIQNSSTYPVPPPIIKSDPFYTSYSNNLQNTSRKEEMDLQAYLQKFSSSKKEKGNQITIPEFRSVLKAAFSLMKLLFESKCKLSNLLEADEEKWNLELQNVSNLQKQFSEICALISSPVHLNVVMKKLKHIKKKRELKKKTKLNKLSEKIKMEQNRKERNQEIDKYLDDIKEKNAKLKREAEMKKEADYILSEVRKKIHEAKRTIEKIKVFEKLRSARQANAVQKGLHVLPDHNEKFEKKVTRLKEVMLKQLADYEAEEKALKVMLETEQEGQLEEETQWKLKKVKTLQDIKKNHIIECLFGNSEEPLPSDPLYLFHKYHTSANSSIENLVQIRHQWDVHIAEDGDAVPQSWVVPVPPSSSAWEQYFTTSLVLKN